MYHKRNSEPGYDRHKAWRKRNPEKVKGFKKSWNQRNPEKHERQMRSAQLKYKYGISADDYDNMLLAQNGVCKICQTHTTVNRLHVDHNHNTGKVRGLLCSRCNQAIGLLLERVDLAQNLMDYLISQGGY